MSLGVSDPSFGGEMAAREEFAFEESCLYFFLYCRHAPDRKALVFFVTLVVSGVTQVFLLPQINTFPLP